MFIDLWAISESGFCLSSGEYQYQAEFRHFQSDIAIFHECNLVSLCPSFQVSVLPHWLIFIFICPWTFLLFTTVF